MLRRMFLAAILAGIAAGLVMSAVQHVRVTPYILAAEVYEQQPQEHSANLSATAPETEPGQHESEAWSPADGLERTAYTVLANLILSVAFALVLGGASLLLGMPITLANGALWGLCGFLAFALAPAAGLPPELPGMTAADLVSRQIWWWFAAAMTAGGLALAARHRSGAYLAVSGLLITLPHIIGAPDAPGHETSVPAHLVSGFVANALATAAVFWVVLGLALGFMAERTSKERSAQ